MHSRLCKSTLLKRRVSPLQPLATHALQPPQCLHATAPRPAAGHRHKSDRVDWLTGWLVSLSLHLCCRCLMLRPGCSLTIDVARSELVRATLMLWSTFDGGHMAISGCSQHLMFLQHDQVC